MADDEFIGPTQARERLHLASMSHPIVRAVDMAARHNRLSEGDRYALMAYHLLQSEEVFKRLALEHAQRAMPGEVRAIAAAIRKGLSMELARMKRPCHNTPRNNRATL